MFHNLRAYDSHLIFCELKNQDAKIDVMPNRSLVKNLSDKILNT